MTTTATPFRTVLVANRGEIALRVMRTARRLGLATVAVYSSADAGAPHVRAADRAVAIGGARPAESYLSIAALIEAARRTGADAVHPGYGFLAENAAFAQACRAAGLVFVGPSAEAIAAMGDKAGAKRLMRRAGVPCIEGYEGADQSDATLAAEAAAIGYPVMIKASTGGGGRGMRRVAGAAGFAAALQSARSEAQGAFGSSAVILERALVAPRHIEVQVFADRHGHVVHLGERDCSVQRRHQKLIEETPSPAVDAALRERLGAAAVAAIGAMVGVGAANGVGGAGAAGGPGSVVGPIGYEGAGTIEFLLKRDGSFRFMEMNTRLQVEHPVTEAITGLDLVEWQFRVAAGEALPSTQSQLRFDGHAIEVRLCAEDPAHGFMPQSGTLALWQPAEGVRVEHALHAGIEIAPHYDSMIAKLVAHGSDREAARRRMLAGLEQTVALGLATNRDYLMRCLANPVFAAGEATTAFVAEQGAALAARDADGDARLVAVGALALLQSRAAADGHAGEVAEGHASAGTDGYAGGATHGCADTPTDGHASAPADGYEGAAAEGRMRAVVDSHVRASLPVHPLAHRLPLPIRLAIGERPVAAQVVRGPAQRVTVEIDGRRHAFDLVERRGATSRFICDGVLEHATWVRDGDRLWLDYRAQSLCVDDRTLAAPPARAAAGGGGVLRASMNGRVVAVLARPGARVEAGQPMLTLEAMKMEHVHSAPRAGVVAAVHVVAGEQIAAGKVVVTLE